VSVLFVFVLPFYVIDIDCVAVVKKSFGDISKSRLQYIDELAAGGTEGSENEADVVLMLTVVHAWNLAAGVYTSTDRCLRTMKV